jgi:hypothetical protein
MAATEGADEARRHDALLQQAVDDVLALRQAGRLPDERHVWEALHQALANVGVDVPPRVWMEGVVRDVLVGHPFVVSPVSVEDAQRTTRPHEAL